jgi:hypothetical protein
LKGLLLGIKEYAQLLQEFLVTVAVINTISKTVSQ